MLKSDAAPKAGEGKIVKAKVAGKNAESKSAKEKAAEAKEMEAKSAKIDTEKLSGKQVFLLCFCGALIGLVNGFFGGGGGMICVPLLERLLHLPSKYSHATAIVIILPISFVSAIIYFLNGNLQTVPFVTVGSGVVLGGIVGSFLLKFLPAKVIKIIFVLIMLAGGIRLLF